MENKFTGRPFWPIGVVFVITSLFFVMAPSLLAGWNMDNRVLLAGNIILFAATVISFSLYSRTLRNANPQFFVRMIYSSLLIRMLFCLVATGLYLFFAGSQVSKMAILGCFVLYLLYTFLEVRTLTQLFKKVAKNA